MTDQPVLHTIDYATFLSDVQALGRMVAADGWSADYVVGVGRGGLVPAVYLSHQLGLPMLSIDHSAKVPAFADELLAKVAEKSRSAVRLLFVDDINDSGGTIDYIRRLLSTHGCEPDNLRFAVLLDNVRSQASVDYRADTIDRADDKRWFVFPWEAVSDNAAIVAEAQSVPHRLA